MFSFQNMKSKNGVNTKKKGCFRITRGTQFIATPFVILLPGTVLLLWLVHFPEAEDSIIAHYGIGVTLNCWIITVILALWALISGMNKRVLLRINDEGIAFRYKKYFHEYQWNELDYIFEKRENFFSPVLCIKVSDVTNPYRVNLDGYLFTFIPIRMAFHHYHQGQTKYYTGRQWKNYYKNASGNS